MINQADSSAPETPAPDAEPTPRHNPELYARLSKASDSKEAAIAKQDAFLGAVRKLREEHCIPELLIVIATYYDSGERVGVAGRMALGNSSVHAELGAIVYHAYTAPEIDRAERLRKIALEGGE